MKRHKVVVIGGGPGGYVTAIRLSQYGIDTVVFEKERLGGVCLNWGCIPTKTLVKVADFYGELAHANELGISINDYKVDYNKVWERKNLVVEKLVAGIEFMFKKRNIPNIKEVVTKISKTDNGYLIKTLESEYLADYVIIATGSKPKELPFMKFDGELILSSRDILKMSELPEKLVIVGGGVVGCEFASIYHQLGVQVEIVEFLPRLISSEDEEISKRMVMALKRSGIKVHLKTGVEGFEEVDGKAILKLSKGKEIVADKVLVSVGRSPVFDIELYDVAPDGVALDGVALDDVALDDVAFNGVELATEDNFISIDENMRTNLPNVFAIGDVTGKMMLAHAASKQGLQVADIINNEINDVKKEVVVLNYNHIPSCIFTHPEIGSVGLSEADAKEQLGDYHVGKFPFTANGKALGLGETFGFVKAISDKNHKLVGMHIMGPQATELIAQGGILIGTEAKVEDFKKIIFAHPTLSEAVMEAVEDLENLAIHKI